MNALAATAPVLPDTTSGHRSAASVLARGFARLAALVGVDTAVPTADELWFLRTSGTAIEAVPYRRGRLAFAPAAAESLLRMGARDRLRLRGVLDELAQTAAQTPEARRAGGSLFVAGGALIVAEFPEAGPALVVCQLA